MSRAWGWLVAVLAVAVLFWTGQRAERQAGVREAALRASEAREASLLRERDSLRRAYRVDTVRLWRAIRTLDTLTLTVEQWKHDTLRVVEYVAQADTAAKACTRAVATCERRAFISDSLYAEAAAQRDTLRKDLGRPWTSAGIAYDPLSGALGPFVARDVWRVRLGVMGLPATPTAPARLILSAGLRW